MGGKERPIVERARDIIESDRTQDALWKVEITSLPQNAFGVHMQAGLTPNSCLLAYYHTEVDMDNQDCVQIGGKDVSSTDVGKLVIAGISIGANSRPGGRIISRLTQKDK